MGVDRLSAGVSRPLQTSAPNIWSLARVCRILACAVLVVSAVALALAADDVASLSPAEKFVLHELESGREGDLSAFPKDKRVLGHKFVEDLITGSYRHPEIQRRGVSIVGAVFQDAVEVSSTAIPFRVWLKSCEFEDGIDFSFARLASDLSFQGSHFGAPPSGSQHGAATPDAQAYFAGMKVEGKAVFSETVSYVPIDFTHAQFGADLEFRDVSYQAGADFQDVTVKGPLSFVGGTFAGELSLADADLFDLFLQNPTRPVALDLSQARIEHGARLKNVSLSSWKAGSLRAQGLVKLDSVTPTGNVDLSHSHFENLVIMGFDDWLKLKPNKLNLEGFSFETLDIGDSNVEPRAGRLLDLLNSPSCPFSPQPYLELEKFLRAHGNAQKADEVYIDMRRRQRSSMFWLNRPWDFLLDGLLGYGKETWRTVLCAVLITIIGAFVFTPNRMEWKNPTEPQTRYSRFWYSLDEFAPVIDFGEARNWKPKEDRHWTRSYARFHRVAGWILLPLIVGAITGIVK